MLKGKTREEVEAMTAAFRDLLHGRPVPPDVDLGDLEALEGVKNLPVRVKCALLAWTTMEDALRAWRDGGVASHPSTTEGA